jgi:hypothetical protein
MAVVEISRRANVDRRAPFALQCQTTCFGVFNSLWNCLLKWEGEQSKVVDYNKVSFYAFSEVSAEDVRGREARVWVRQALDKSCYLTYTTFAGSVQLTPAGHRWFG